MKPSLVVVASREPYFHNFGKGSAIVCRSQAGGVHVALDAVLRRRGGVWVAWGSGTADRRVVDSGDGIRVPPAAPRYRLRRVWLSERTAENFYRGYSNQVLWPLCHSLPGRIRFRRRFWESYRQANALFAQAAIEESRRLDSPLFWTHDYQLALLPTLLREGMPEAPIAHFWHIPWPGWEVFRSAPQGREILGSLLRADWIGFHLEDYVENFLRCAQRELGATVRSRKGIVEWKGRRIRVRAVPIGIDAREFRTLASLEDSETKVERLRRRFGIETPDFGIGVDRLDYAKGILERLDALRLLFRRYPALRGSFTFLQIAPPSREGIPAYQEHRARVRQEVRRINRLFRKESWKPVLLAEKKLPPGDLALLYRAARVAVVTSLRDGMNLVAKEFAASQVERRGALVLSRFAGASKELREAILVNPFDVESITLAVKKALRMSPEERSRRLKRMQERVFAHDIHDWSREVFKDIQRSCRRRAR